VGAWQSAEVGAAFRKLRALLTHSSTHSGLQPSRTTMDALLLSLFLVELRHSSSGAGADSDSSGSGSGQSKNAHRGGAGGVCWTRWVHTLPGVDAVDSPSCWSEPELRLLRGTPVHGVAAARRAWLDGLSSSLPPLLEQAGLDRAAVALRRCVAT
jgi:hypothetical protein